MAKKEMKNKKTWEEFQECGMLWFINSILHAFGWALVYSYEKKGDVIPKTVYPARVRFRGFNSDLNSDGYRKISKYMRDNCDELYEESKE